MRQYYINVLLPHAPKDGYYEFKGSLHSTMYGYYNFIDEFGREYYFPVTYTIIESKPLKTTE